MSIDQCRSIVLSAMPYRESSLLLNLFSRTHGRLHAIAKGVRRADKRSTPLERGYVIDHLAYIGRNRDLHLVTDINLREHFPSIRGDIEKTAARDVLLDLLLAAIKDTEPHPDLYDYLERILGGIDAFATDAGVGLLLYVAKSVFTVAAHLGFGVDFTTCAGCGDSIADAGSAGVLSLTGGTVNCATCAAMLPAGAGRLLSGEALHYFSVKDEAPPPPHLIALRESLRLLHCATDYCRYHADVRKPLVSLVFIDELFNRGDGDTATGRVPVQNP